MTDNRSFGSSGKARTGSDARPLGREHMPTDFSISLANYTNRGTPDEVRIPENFGPKQSLQGFESRYQNIIDYIVRITYRIWEDRDVNYIADTYSETSHVYDDYGLQLGNKKIIDDTHHTTRAFSDIQLIADEVIWAGNDEIGFHTSHRTIIRGKNDGDSKYGPATNKNVDVLVIANCVALENEIFLEHVLYNNSSLLQQLGYNLQEVVPKLCQAAPAGWPRSAQTWNELRAATAPAQPLSISSPIEGFDVDKFSRHTLNQLWNAGNFDVLNASYAENFTFHGPTDREFRGKGAYRDFLNSLRGAFPDLQLQVDEVYWMGNEREGFLTSERWSAQGTHNGHGVYGEPTNKSVQIWGITQHHIVDGVIVKEWMLFNELDLLMQLHA